MKKTCEGPDDLKNGAVEFFLQVILEAIFKYYIFSEEMRNKNTYCASEKINFLCYYVYSYLFQWNDM